MSEPDDTASPTQTERASGVDARLLEILVCPVTRGPLEYDRAAGELISRRAGLAYPIRGGVPVLIEDEARPIEET